MSEPMSQDAEPPALELVDVHKLFLRPDGSAVCAANAVSFKVERGETLALIGESGSGKSTLGRIALCLTSADSGKVFFNGVCLSDLKAGELQSVRIGMQPIFQDPSASFNPRRRVLPILSQALLMRGPRDTEARAVALLEDVGLRPGREFLRRYPHELSGGQRQRLAIARALAADPVLVIADEPLSGADVSIRGQILNLLVDLQERRNLSYLMITHDITIARALARRVIVLKDGEIVETGLTEDVLDNPQHAYTRRLVAAVPVLKTRQRVAK
jgi:ABC-type glutathione transport system ATPase component